MGQLLCWLRILVGSWVWCLSLFWRSKKNWRKEQQQKQELHQKYIQLLRKRAQKTRLNTPSSMGQVLCWLRSLVGSWVRCSSLFRRSNWRKEQQQKQELHQYTSNCYGNGLKRRALIHLRIWDSLFGGFQACLWVVEYDARHFFDGPTGESSSNRSKNFTNIHPIVTKTGSKDAP